MTFARKLFSYHTCYMCRMPAMSCWNNISFRSTPCNWSHTVYYHAVVVYGTYCCRISNPFSLKEPNHYASSYSAPKSDSFCKQCLLLNYSLIFYILNTTILFVHISIKLKVHLAAKNYFLWNWHQLLGFLTPKCNWQMLGLQMVC